MLTIIPEILLNNNFFRMNLRINAFGMLNLMQQKINCKIECYNCGRNAIRNNVCILNEVDL